MKEKELPILPILRHSEVKENKKEIEETLEAEKMFFEHKFLREEFLALHDEILQYFDYNNLVASDFFQLLPEKLQEEIGNHIKERADIKKRSGKERDESQNNPLLEVDLKKVFDYGQPEIIGNEEDEEKWDKQLRRHEFDSFLKQSIAHIKHEEFSHNDLSKKEKEKAVEQSTDTVFWSLNLKLLRREKVNKILESYTEEDHKKIQSYIDAVAPFVMDALGKEQFLGNKISQAKKTRVNETLMSTKTLSELHEIKPEEINKHRKESMPLSEQPRGFRINNEKKFNLIKELRQSTDEVIKEDLKKKIQEAEEKAEAAWDKAYPKNQIKSVEEIHQEAGNIIEKEAIPAYVKYMQEFKRLKKLLDKGEIIETDQITGIIDQAMSVINASYGEKPQIVYFHGDFGTGKTALAVHICKTKIKKEPIIVAGNKFLEPERFTEEYRLQKLAEKEHYNIMLKQLGLIDKEPLKDDDDLNLIVEKITTKEELFDLVVETYKVKNNKDVDEKVEENIRQDIEAMFENKIQGRYVLGAMYEAMKEGRPLIIDEANAISPDVLIGFNDLLTKKIGASIETRSDSGKIEIKPGYCIIFTGNSGERFKSARFNDIDPAFYSRIMPIRVDYLPQSVSSADSGLNDLLDRFNLDSLSELAFGDDEEALKMAADIRKRAKNDQIFQVLMIKLLNSRMGAYLLAEKGDRFKTIKEVYRLSVAARMIMDLFERKSEGFPNIPSLERLIGSSTGKVVADKLKKTNLSMRELIDNIIGGYMSDGASMDIEWYVFKFIRSRNITPEEQAIVMAIFQSTKFFDSSEGWPDFLEEATNPSDLTAKLTHFKPLDHVDKYKKIDHNGDEVPMLSVLGKDHKMAYINSLEMLQAVFGYLPALDLKHYQGLQKNLDSKKEKPEAQEINEYLGNLVISKIKEIIGLIELSWFDDKLDNYLNFIEPIQKEFNQLKEFSESDLSKNKEEIENICHQINKSLIDLIEEVKTKRGKLAEIQEELDAAREADVASQIEFISKQLKELK